METREEIEDMKVSELREFLKRHGTLPAQVTRVDGTPGQPRKADLLQAALDIEESYRAGNPLNSMSGSGREQNSEQPSLPNPFQSKLPSPSSRRASLPSGEENRSRRNSLTTPRRDQTEVRQSIPNQFTPRERTRRRSSTPWIDPNLLKSLKTTTRQSEPEIITPSDRVAAVPDEDPEVQEVPVQRRERPGRHERPTDHDHRALQSKQDEPIQSRRRSLRGQPIADDPPPPPPRRGASPETEAVTYLGRGPLLEDDENDLDFDIDKAMNDIGDIYENEDLFNAEALDEDNNDILVQSDYEGTASAAESDFDSTVDTDEEARDTSFDEWGLLELKRYLSRHNMRFPVGASKSDLVCLVRAHSLQMETEMDQAKAPSRSAQQTDEDGITPAAANNTRKSSSRRSARRRRIISAPSPDDDDEEARPKRRERRSKQFNVDDFAANQRESRRRKISKPAKQKSGTLVQVLISFFTKSLFPISAILLLGLAVWAGFTVLKDSRRPYCAASDMSQSEDTDGCIPCPKNGDCSTGVLICDPGYVRVASTCMEDKGNTEYATEIVQDAYRFLAHHAGRAECGEVESKFVKEDELFDIIEVQHANKKVQSIFPWLHREYNPDRFTLAFRRALLILREPGSEGFLYDPEEEAYAASEARTTIWCATKLMLQRNWQIVLGVLGFMLLSIYARIYLWLRKRDRIRLADKYQDACDHLSDRKRGYLKGDEEFAFISDVVLRQEVLGYPTQKNIQFWKRVEEVLKNDKRIAYTPNRTIKGAPMNTFEWRGRMATGDLMTSDGSVRSYEGSVYSEGFSSHTTPNRVPVTPNSRLEGVRKWLWNN